MAEPIPLEITPRDPRAELRARLDSAPVEHAEALLAGYEVLQELHDKGMLDMLRGVIGARDHLLKQIVDASKTPEAIRAMRNLVILAKLTASIDPELLGGMASAVSESLAQAKTDEPLSLLQLLKKLGNADSRRALTALTCALESAGKALAQRAD